MRRAPAVAPLASARRLAAAPAPGPGERRGDARLHRPAAARAAAPAQRPPAGRSPRRRTPRRWCARWSCARSCTSGRSWCARPRRLRFRPRSAAQPAAPVAAKAAREGNGEEAGACEEGRRQAGAGHEPRPRRPRPPTRPRCRIRPSRQPLRRLTPPPRLTFPPAASSSRGDRARKWCAERRVFPPLERGRPTFDARADRHAGGAAGARVAATPFPR